METKIVDILRELMAYPSLTNTREEIAVEIWLKNFLGELPYFKSHPKLYGAMKLPGDTLERSVIWALVRGRARKSAAGQRAEKRYFPLGETGSSWQKVGGLPSPTVILMGHHDVVSTSVYGKAEPWARNLDIISEKLTERPLSSEAKTDLLSGEWIFGRGSCDMKGGIAVQLAVLAQRSEVILAAERAESEHKTGAGKGSWVESGLSEDDADLAGSLLFLSVPDEESFSVGMRGSVRFLEELRALFFLDYRLAVCSEPNRRLSDGRTQVINSGSVGKMLPVVLIQGKLVQVGNSKDGINPLEVLGRLISATEGDEAFTETCGEERSVPPVWLYARDLKEGYDFSLPQRAAGCCNILTFRKTPAQVLAYFLGKIQSVLTDAPSTVSVMTWAALRQKAAAQYGYAAFAGELEAEAADLLQKQHKTFPEVTLRMIERTLDFLQIDTPAVILGFAPPYYPAVRSEDLAGEKRLDAYKAAINKEIPILLEPYFLGVSDCSYCGLPSGENSPAYQANTPLWGKLYRFDMEALARLAIPFFLIGPWGKDLHQSSERVNRYSLTQEYPRILQALLRCVWLTK